MRREGALSNLSGHPSRVDSQHAAGQSKPNRGAAADMELGLYMVWSHSARLCRRKRAHGGVSQRVAWKNINVAEEGQGCGGSQIE